MSRLQQLLKFLEEEPNDPFNVYVVALEYQKLDSVKAEEYFGILLRDYPDYVPTYYHLAKHFESQQQRDKAIEVYSNGIQKALEQNDQKALKELRNALNELMFD